ncbi:hypothetical protein OQA88_8673 [Cercophora sp. LCS_1]
MQLTTFATILLAATPIFAAPAPTTEDIAARGTKKPQAQALMDLWKNADFLGIKFTGEGSLDTCYNLDGFMDQASSAKARDNFRCTIWVDKNCKGTGFSFIKDDKKNPEQKNFPSWINDKASSWKCVKN